MRKIIILVSAAVLLAALGITALVAIGNSPGAILSRSITGAMKDFSEREELSHILSASEQGSFHVSAKYETSILGKIEGGMKFYCAEEALYLEDLRIAFGKDDIAFDAYADFKKEYGYVESREFLSGAYGVKNGDRLETLFRSSIFAYGADSDFAISDEARSEAVASLLRMLDDGAYEEFREDLEKILTRYAVRVKRLIGQYGVYTTEKGMVEVGGEEIFARTVTLSFRVEDLRAALSALLEELKEDDELRRFLARYRERMDVVNVLTEQKTDPEKAFDEVLKALEEEINRLESGAEQGKEAFAISVVTPRGGARLLRFALRLDGEERFVLDAGRHGLKESDRIALYEVDRGGLVYERRVTSSETYEGRLTVLGMNGGADLMMDFYIAWQKGEWTFEMRTGDKDKSDETWEQFFLSRGTCERDGDCARLTMDYFRVEQDEFRSFTVSLAVNRKDAMPTVKRKGEVKSFFMVSEEEFGDVVEFFEDIFS